MSGRGRKGPFTPISACPRPCQARPERVASALFRDLQQGLQRPSVDLLGSRFMRKNAPVAQLDRASDYESEGRTFESFRARHKIRPFLHFELIPVGLGARWGRK